VGKRAPSGWEGFLNLAKPAGPSSGDCVYRLRRLLGERRIGHGGTLDPGVRGVLPVAVGTATRLLNYLPGGKAYRAVVRLGVRTDTDDLEGAVLSAAPVPELARQTVEEALAAFRGEIAQTPPRYSAVRQGGKRLYDLARAGRAPDLADIPSRQVVIAALTVVAWHPGEFPEIVFDVECSAGTYIRAIARDLGEKLGCGATLAALVRTRAGHFRLADSLDFETIEAQLASGNLRLLGPETALAHLPTVQLAGAEARAFRCGRALPQPEEPTGICQVWQWEGPFLGIGRLEGGLLHPTAVLMPA